MVITSSGLALAAGIVTLAMTPGLGSAYVDFPAESLASLCRQRASDIAVLRVAKVRKDKYGIVFQKVRDLKGKYPGERLSLVLREEPANARFHPADSSNHQNQRRCVLDWAEEGKTAVVLFSQGNHVLCLGAHWVTVTVEAGRPPAEGPWVLPAGCDSRFLRFYCGDAEGFVTAVTEILAGKKVAVPCVVGDVETLSHQLGPIRRLPADFKVKEFHNPFHGQDPPWCTDHGNMQRTGADGSAGPKKPKIAWVWRSHGRSDTSPIPGEKALYASSFGAADGPGFHALVLDPSSDRRVLWSKQRPYLKGQVPGPPGAAVGQVIFGDGTDHQERATLYCLRDGDGLPLWQLSLTGKLRRFQGTPAIAGRKVYVGGGSAGILCLNPHLVRWEGKDHDLGFLQNTLETRWRELKAKHPLGSTDDLLPKPAPQLLWQQGQGKWQFDAPLGVVEDRVLAVSAYLDKEKVGERALVCFNAVDGSVLWKTSLGLNCWGGPSIGPYVLVGGSSIGPKPTAFQGARGELVAVELDGGAVKWRKEVSGAVLSAVAIKEGLAIFTASDGKVRAWDVYTGQERWSYDARSPMVAGPAATGQTVYVVDRKGVLHAVNLSDGKAQWALDLAADPAIQAPGLVWNAPVVYRGRLYLAASDSGDDGARSTTRIDFVGEE